MLDQDRDRLAVVKLAGPLVFLTLGVLEALAMGISLVSEPSTAGFAAAAGASSFVPVTVAVVFATLLPASPRARSVKGAVAVVALAFAVARVILLVLVFAGGGAARALPLASGLGAVIGTVVGIALAAWAIVDHRQAVPVPAAVTPEAVPEAAPASPATPSVARDHRPLRPVPAAGAPVTEWHRGTTPWPRKDEDDPEGTLIRPPRRA